MAPSASAPAVHGASLVSDLGSIGDRFRIAGFREAGGSFTEKNIDRQGKSAYFTGELIDDRLCFIETDERPQGN
jgi:hypothetical protein